jgi:hypothetical protein
MHENGFYNSATGSPKNWSELGEMGSALGVVMLDVIEHLINPVPAIREVHDMMAEGGGLLITTGDWESLAARWMGRYWRLMTPPQHLFFISRGSITKLLERAGFEVLDFVHPWKLVPLGLTAYQLENRLRSVREGWK